MKLVVCDDDVTLRGVVSKLATAAGYTVLAETDSATDAVDLVERFGAQVLVLDLALPWGGGMAAVRELRERASTAQVVVFTSYASDDPAVAAARVRAVIEKPDFERLENVLGEIIDGGPGGVAPAGAERRARLPERRSFPPVLSASPSGLEEPSSYAAALDALTPGDAVLAVRVGGIDRDHSPYGRILLADRVLLVARTLRTVLRVQDRLSTGDEDVELTALLLNCARGGVLSVWHRLERAHEVGGGAGVLSAGWALVEAEAPTTTMARARDGARRGVGRPPGDRLWAG